MHCTVRFVGLDVHKDSITMAVGRVGTSTTPDRQNVWGLRYIDDLVLRDRSASSILDERLYCLQDANWNVTSIVDAAGAVQERYAYSAYGVPEFLNPDFTIKSSSEFDWNILYAGYLWNALVQFYHVRNRAYDPLLGAWLQRDPLKYADGSSLTQYVHSSHLILTDPLGLLCVVNTDCVNLAGGTYLGGIVHCGLSIVDSSGATTHFHVDNTKDWTNHIANGRVFTPVTFGTYWPAESKTVPDNVCECIKATASRITSTKIPYNPIPTNEACGGDPQGNSNYSTKCLLSHCGLSSKFDTQIAPPVGWNHRMKKCVKVNPYHPPCEGASCICDKWETRDDDWCKPRTLGEVAANPRI